MVKADLGVALDLASIARQARDIQYNPKKWPGAVWRHRHIAGTCLFYKSGKVICNGNNSIASAKRSLRKYARLLQGYGNRVKLDSIQIQTMSAVHDLAMPVDLKSLGSIGGAYEPELFNACHLKKGRVHFTIFSTGKIIITGVKSQKLLQTIVYPTIFEIAMS